MLQHLIPTTPTQQRQIEGLAPTARGGHACASVGSRLVVFGGSDRAPISYDDLWVLDAGGAAGVRANMRAACRSLRA